MTRPVVTRLTPAPAPAAFHPKAPVVHESKGAPVATAQAIHPPQEARVIRPTKSVVTEPGQVKLAPKNAQAAIPAPIPVRRDVPPAQAHREALPAATHEPPPAQAKNASAPERQVVEQPKAAQPRPADPKKEKDNKGDDKNKRDHPDQKEKD
jgi:hypothetical protein